MLVAKQIELSETFGEMIDEVLRAATQRDTQQEGINSYAYFFLHYSANKELDIREDNYTRKVLVM